MAYNNDEKNYSDYFKSLENRISNERAHIKPLKEKTAQKSRRVYPIAIFSAFSYNSYYSNKNY